MGSYLDRRSWTTYPCNREHIDAEVYLSLFRRRLRRFCPDLYGGNSIFQHDNAPAHQADLVQKWFKKYDIQVLDWPSKSPDLNIIEGIWNHMKYKLRGKVFTTEDELWTEIQGIWDKIALNFIHKFYRSLPERMRELIRAKGGHIKY